MSTTSSPGPAERVTRTAAQVGGAMVVLELVLAFDWIGSASWTERQVKAVTGLTIFAASVGQNLVGHFRSRSWRHLPRAISSARRPPGV